MSAKSLKSTTRATRAAIGAAAGLSMLGVAAEPSQAAPNDAGDAAITGVVFSDKNANGLQDRGERGIPNVSVSDGVTVVRTDSQGRYTVRTDPQRRADEIVFVTQPDGYLAPPDQAMTPQFFRNVGPLAAGQSASADIGLVPAPHSATTNFSYALISDPQTLNLTDAGQAVYEGLLAQINELSAEPAFVIDAGDLTQNATVPEFQRYAAATGSSRTPVWPSVGNHDIIRGTDIYANYRTFLGPEWYSFDHGGRHFVVMENNESFRDPAQLEWLRQDLALNAVGKKVVVTVHRPFQAPPTAGGANGPAAYIELLEQYDVELVHAGHTHKNDVDLTAVAGAAHVVTNASSGTLDQTPNGFRVVTFTGNRVTFPFKMYDVRRSLTITNPAPGAKVPAGSRTVQVNAYNTTTNVTGVSYRVDNGPWKKLDQSSHITWVGELAGRPLAVGQHSIGVRATDDTGASWDTTSTFEVVPADTIGIPRSGTPWSMQKAGPAYTGVTLDVIDPATLQLAWSYRTAGTILTSSPVIVDGVVYAGTRDDDGADNHAVHAVDLATGKGLWRVPTDGNVEGTPVVANGIVYASTTRGTLLALDASTGKQVWSITKGDEVGDGVHRGWMYEQPNYADGVIYQVYSIGERRLTALDAATGAVRWDVRLNGGWINETPPALGGGRLYVDGDGSWLIAVNAATGAEEWRASGLPCTNTTPTYADELLYLGCQGGHLVALDAATGKLVWRYTSTDPTYDRGVPTGSSPAIADGVAYMGFSNGHVTAFDAHTGAVLWTHRTAGGVTSAPAVSGDTVYVGSNDGHVYGFDRATGEVRWSYEIGAWVSSSPAISGNALVVGAFDGNLYAFTDGTVVGS